MAGPKPIELDGRTGEGGGQLVRIAIALASVISQPVKITNVRGLKSQHVTSIAWLAKATNADVKGLEVGSHTLEFAPNLPPSAWVERKISISSDSSAASTLLVFQAIYPFLLFAGGEDGQPIEVEISGGTNVSFSLSYEYLDQVLLPSLEYHFGLKTERKLISRGWSVGTPQRGAFWVKVYPLKIGETLKPKTSLPTAYSASDFEVKTIDVSMIVPVDMHESLQNALVDDLEKQFPDAEVNFKLVEDSRKDSRMNVLLVARSDTLRWGRDILFSRPKKLKRNSDLSPQLSARICEYLRKELAAGGVVDEFLHDQLVVFQALAEGTTSFPRNEDDTSLEEDIEGLSVDDNKKKDKTQQPWGEGSTHTKTARWVASELLPGVEWYNKGRICKGIGATQQRLVEDQS